jgi:hypothetical protein
MPKGQRGFKKGHPPMGGRPLGSVKEKSFTEYFNEIAEEIALANKMDVEDVKKVIYKVGYAKAKEGNYQFYKDILDRIHGKAKENFDITSGGQPIYMPSEILSKYKLNGNNNANTSPENNS